MSQPEIAFLFGAGASFGAGAIEPSPPPLGNRLYAELRGEFAATWGALEDDEKALFALGSGPSFEDGMKLLWEKFDERASPALIDMAIYFSRFRPPRGQSDCYSRLVIALRALALLDASCFTTLNYECLLEIASTRVGVLLNYSGEPKPGQLSISKPHGSCNFLVRMNVENVTLIGSPAMQNLVMGEPDVVTDLDEVERKFRSGYSIPPAMSMYESRKHTPVNLGFIQAFRDDWQKWAENASLIVIVGANPLLRDGHIWDPVFNSHATVWYIGGTSGDDYSAFTERLGARLEQFGRRFEACLKPLLERLRDFRDNALVIAPD